MARHRWQCHPKGTSLADLALNFNAPMSIADDPFRYRQSQPDATPAGFRGKKRVEKMAEMLWLNAIAGIRQTDLDLLPLAGRANL